MDGNTLITWGYSPGPWFKDALKMANDELAKGTPLAYVEELVRDMAPPDKIGMRTNSLPFAVFANPETEAEQANIDAVIDHMDKLVRVPTIKAAAVMPDACPAGSAPGTIPVGGVVACENAIHPGFHSADICCSVMASVLGRGVAVEKILDTAQKVSHFGPGGRTDQPMSEGNRGLLERILEGFAGNPFLKDLEGRARYHFMTQGDGNHFFFVGGKGDQTVIATHHGSRGLGADLYKRGKACAERMTAKIASGIPSHQAWIPADTQEGRDYWEALQIVRRWTKLNHAAIHDAVARSLGVRVADRVWNEHNFVFQKPDGLFYHAKGATPAYSGFAADDSGLTLIPLNMKAGILVADHATHKGPEAAMGFAPHGAGRNMSRSQHMRMLTDKHGDSRGLSDRSKGAILAEETAGIDARFWTGRPDLSELPSAYKDADMIKSEIATHNLANVTGHIRPLGSIMAGNDERDWRSIKAKKQET